MMSTMPVAARRRTGESEPPFGKVGNRVRAESPEWCGHGDEKDEVTSGVPDCVPECAEPFEHGQPGDTEKGGGGQVLARDGGGVEKRGNLAGGHHEVGRRPGDADSPVH